MGRPRAQLCDLGVWGRFDADSFGEVLAGRIAERELGRRLPSGAVRLFAPLGGDRAIPKDPGEPPETLGRWSGVRVDEVVIELDVVVIEVGAIGALDPEAVVASYPGLDADDPASLDPWRWFVDALAPMAAAGVPVVWQDAGIRSLPPDRHHELVAALTHTSLVTVRDDASAKALVEAGFDGELTVVPPTVLLVNRLFPPDLSRHRLEYLRTMGWFPTEREAIVVQGGLAAVERVDEVAAALADLLGEHPDDAVVLIETEPGDAVFADELVRRVPSIAHRLPDDAGIEDLAAAIAAARAVISSSYTVHAVACASQRPSVVLDFTSDPGLEGLTDLFGENGARVSDVGRLRQVFDRVVAQPTSATVTAALEHRIDGHFDRVANIASPSHRRARPSTDQAQLIAALESRLARLQRAHEIRGRRLVDERVAFGEQVRAVAFENLVLRNELEDARRRADEAFEAAEHDAATAGASRRQRDEALAELDRMRRTRTFRYTESLRKVYGDLRRRWP